MMKFWLRKASRRYMQILKRLLLFIFPWWTWCEKSWPNLQKRKVSIDAQFIWMILFGKLSIEPLQTCFPPIDLRYCRLCHLLLLIILLQQSVMCWILPLFLAIYIYLSLCLLPFFSLFFLFLAFDPSFVCSLVFLINFLCLSMYSDFHEWMILFWTEEYYTQYRICLHC